MPRQRPHATLWFEVEDLLRFFDDHNHPTGIQRVTLELLEAAVRRYAGRVAFCRLRCGSGKVEALDLAAIRGLLTTPRVKAFRGQAISAWIQERIGRRNRERSFAQRIQAGDFLVCVGSPMANRSYSEHVRRLKERWCLKFCLLIHDVLPLVQPAYFNSALVSSFLWWAERVVHVTDIIFVSSEHSRNEVIDIAREKSWKLPPFQAVRFGDGFSVQPEYGEFEMPKFPDRFVLFVSTLEARKNHRLLVDVWKRLLQRHSPHEIPVLMFVGRTGWLINELMADLKASRFLNGKIVHFRNLSDRALREAYARCLFTVYPSLHEGWGLPVAESLVAGKLCIASNRSSIPEVGGDLVEYFDPCDANDCLAKIERALTDPDYLEARSRRISQQFVPASWDACIDSIVANLDSLADLSVRRSCD